MALELGLQQVSDDVCTVNDSVTALAAEVGKTNDLLASVISDKSDRSELTKGLSAKAEKAEFDELLRIMFGILIAIAGTAVMLVVDKLWS